MNLCDPLGRVMAGSKGHRVLFVPIRNSCVSQSKPLVAKKVIVELVFVPSRLVTEKVTVPGASMSKYHQSRSRLVGSVAPKGV